MKPQHEAYAQWDRLRREETVREHLPLVYRLARRVANSVELRGLELNDLVHAGVIGLYQALDRYDASRGVPFGAFAMRHVRGRMLDEIARHHQLPRGLRERQARLHAAYDHLSQQLMREPSDEELADALGIPVAELHEWWVDLGWTAAFSLEDLEAQGQADVPDPEDTFDPARRLDRQAARAQLVQALHRLTPREQQVLWLYYEEDLTLKEIGEVLDLSESQVSRIRSKAILRLRGMLTGHARDG